MLFEDMMLLFLLGSGIFLIGIPTYKLVKHFIPVKKDPVKDAKQRLEMAKLELEAAKLNKEVENMYETLYTETLEENKENNKNHE